MMTDYEKACENLRALADGKAIKDLVTGTEVSLSAAGGLVSGGDHANVCHIRMYNIKQDPVSLPEPYNTTERMGLSIYDVNKKLTDLLKYLKEKQ